MKTMPSATAGEESIVGRVQGSTVRGYFHSKFGVCGAELGENLVLCGSCPNIGQESPVAGSSVSADPSAISAFTEDVK